MPQAVEASHPLEQGRLHRQSDGYRSLVEVNKTDVDWISVSGQDLNSPSYHGYVKDKSAQTRLLVLLDRTQEDMKNDATVKALLDIDETDTCPCPIPETVLLVDRDKLQRRLASRQLQDLGCL